MGSFSSILILLIIFWVLFAIIGMFTFGGLNLTTTLYPNYDTFLGSLVSTFNILNMENYQNQWGDVSRATGSWGCSIFFLLWIIIGKYCLVQLFLAVLLEAFEAKYDVTGAGGPGGQSAVGSWFRDKMSGMNSARSARVRV